MDVGYRVQERVKHDMQGHIRNKLLRFSHLSGDGSFRRKKVKRVLAIQA